MKGIKVRVKDAVESELVQQAWFAQGHAWVSGDRVVQDTQYPFLFLSEMGIAYLSIDCEEYFEEHSYKEWSVEEVISGKSGEGENVKTEQVKLVSVNKDFVDAKGFVPKMHQAIAQGMNVGLRGATGTGKTFLVRSEAKKQGKTLYTFNMTVHTGVEELKGRYVVKPGEGGAMQLQWVDGQLVEAMRRGDWVVIEEANFMPEEISSVMYSVMDDRREIVLDEHENEVIKAHPDFRLFLTMNWGYRGTTYPNDAIKNRIDVWFDIDYLPQELEAQLLVEKTGVDKDIAGIMAEFAAKVRESKDRSTSDLSTRTLVRWATLVKGGLSFLEAADCTVVPLLYYAESEKETVRKTLKFFFDGLEARRMKGRIALEKGDVVMHVSDGGGKFGIVKSVKASLDGTQSVELWLGDTVGAAEKARDEMKGAEVILMIQEDNGQEDGESEEI
jgi:nitric oxide reductase NorQ protein